jgi:creatinine amidohydrolase
MAELNWFDVEQYLEHDDRLIWVLGSCEQHAYLSLLTDVLIPQALADAASQQTGVLVAPPLNFGASPYFLAYPGTFSLRISTLLDLVEDVLRSAYRHGFHRIMILNGHGGNDPARGRIYELLNELPGLQVAWYAWWQSHSVGQVAVQHNLKPAHANWVEAFSFTQVADLPALEKLPPHITGLLSADAARLAYGDGSFGGFYQVEPARME